jgi:hypothetical protein
MSDFSFANLHRDKNKIYLRHDVNMEQTMSDWRRLERGLHHLGPLWLRVFGDDLIGTIFEEKTAEGRFAWYVADNQQPGAKTFRQGLAPSIDEAKIIADAAVLDRKRGRVFTTEGELTTSTDRNRRRIDRLLATESLARRLVADLANYHQELVAIRDTKTANRIVLSLRRAALNGLSDYMRRTVEFRARSGAQMASPEEKRADEQAALKIIDELAAFADDPIADFGKVEMAINKLRSTGRFPESELYSAVTQSFLLKTPKESEPLSDA